MVILYLRAAGPCMDQTVCSGVLVQLIMLIVQRPYKKTCCLKRMDAGPKSTATVNSSFLVTISAKLCWRNSNDTENLHPTLEMSNNE